MKSFPRKIFIAAMGPGEISQGMAFAEYALQKGSEILFAVLRSSNFPFLPEKKTHFRKMLATTPRALNALIRKGKPDLLALCNSKIFSWDKYFMKNPPKPRPLTVSIDSNWLFFKKSPYPTLPWVDRYYINFPQKIFRFGLKQFGGNYRISRKMMEKIKVVGLIPSYKPLAARARRDIRKKFVKPGEKLIFLYASVGGLIKQEVFVTLIKAMEVLRKKGRRIRVVHAGDYGLSPSERRRYPWLTLAGAVTTDQFYVILASSDLVFQHQGLGTLGQAISAKVPVIANVRDIDKERNSYHAHAWEVEPFERSGACAMFYFSDPIEKVIKTIETLLYKKEAIKKMRQKQKAIYSSGEKVIWDDIEQLFKRAYEKKKITHRAN